VIFSFSWWKRRRPTSSESSSVRRRTVLEPLRFPLHSPSRIALLDGAFESADGIETFALADIAWLRQYAPEALVCPLDVALSLADQRRRGLLDLPSLNTAIIVITSLEDSALEDHHRDLLWRAFGVPVFEQLRGLEGKIIARECEVHDGLHVTEASVTPHLEDYELVLMRLSGTQDRLITTRTGVSAEIVNEHCECGAETPRLRKLIPLHRKTAAAAGGR
jgi:hypothetical protein